MEPGPTYSWEISWLGLDVLCFSCQANGHISISPPPPSLICIWRTPIFSLPHQINLAVSQREVKQGFAFFLCEVVETACRMKMSPYANTTLKVWSKVSGTNFTPHDQKKQIPEEAALASGTREAESRYQPALWRTFASRWTTHPLPTGVCS